MFDGIAIYASISKRDAILRIASRFALSQINYAIMRLQMRRMSISFWMMAILLKSGDKCAEAGAVAPSGR